MKILYVDDNKYSREIAKVYFAKDGRKLALASSALDAQKKICNNNYDIVIADLMMPTHDGEWLVEWINRMFPNITTIYASCYWERAEKAKLNFIKKPITPENLDEALIGAAWKLAL